MVFYASPWACAIILLIVGIHALVPFVKGLFMRVAMTVNICLHICLVAILLLLGAELSELVVIFMGSLLLYVAFSYFGMRSLERDRRGKDDV